MDKEKRSKSRNSKRLFVRFGPEKPDNIGFSNDFSTSGIFIKTNTIFQPATTLRLEVELPDSRILHLEGIVMWAKKVPASLVRHIKKTGMGVKLIQPPAEYIEFVSGLS